MARRKKAARRQSGPRSTPPAAAGGVGREDAAAVQAMLGTLAEDVAQAEACFRAGIAAGERDLGAALFERHAGRLGTMPEAHGYLICRRSLAQCLADTGRQAEALAECEMLARLDAADTTVARFLHLQLLVTLRRFDAARELCDRQRHETYSGWPYYRALVEFAAGGDSAAARSLLAAAVAANPHVPRLMLAGRQTDHDLTLVTVGAEDEAALYVEEARATWLDVPGAISWLRGATGTALDKPASAARTPGQAAFDLLGSLPQDEAEEWQMHLSRERPGVWSLHVVSGSDGGMIAFDVSGEKPRAVELWDRLSKAMRFPLEGEPRRPAIIAMRPGVFPKSWAGRFARLGIRQEFRDPLGALDRALADVAARMAAAERARAEEADEGFDPVAVAAELADLPREPGEIWEADIRPASAWVTGEGEPYRPWLALVASRTQDRILVPDVTTTRPDDGHLARLVLRAIRATGIRPERLEVATTAMAAALAAGLEPAGVPVTAAVGGLQAIEQVAEALAEGTAGPETLRPLVGVPGMTDTLQRGLYAAAADFYRARPWRRLPGDAPLDVRGPGGRLVHVVVMGQSGVQQGLAIYEDRDALAAALGGDEQAAVRTSSLAVMYGEPFEISPRDYDAIERSGFDVAGPEAWPLVIRLDPGFATRPPLVWEVELITACLRDVVARVSL